MTNKDIQENDVVEININGAIEAGIVINGPFQIGDELLFLVASKETAAFYNLEVLRLIERPTNKGYFGLLRKIRKGGSRER